MTYEEAEDFAADRAYEDGRDRRIKEDRWERDNPNLLRARLFRMYCQMVQDYRRLAKQFESRGEAFKHTASRHRWFLSEYRIKARAVLAEMRTK